MSDTLPVGDELNALLHERVFERCYHIVKWVGEHGVFRCSKCKVQLPEKYVNANYLTGDGMLLLVEKMKVKGWCWYAGEDAEGTFFRFVKQGAGENGADLMASCETFAVELNCAYAALTAMGVLQ